MLPITILYRNTLCCSLFFNAITISTVSDFVCDNKRPDASRRIGVSVVLRQASGLLLSQTKSLTVEMVIALKNKEQHKVL